MQTHFRLFPLGFGMSIFIVLSVVGAMGIASAANQRHLIRHKKLFYALFATKSKRTIK